MSDYRPFRPDDAQLAALADDVAEITGLQDRLVSNHPQLQRRDRVAHQYQIAGSRVELIVAGELPAQISDIGIFVPGSRHVGVGRISTGLGCPHLETDPDFLGLMLALQTRTGRRVDFLAINDPGAPTDTHADFMALLDATVDAAGTEAPFGSGVGQLDLFDLLATNLKVVRTLVRHLGVKRGGGIAMHVLRQTLRTARSATAYQRYWTGVVELGGNACKFAFVPIEETRGHRRLHPGPQHLSEDWRRRQATGPLRFELWWLPYLDERRTPLRDLTEEWETRPRVVAQVVFPRRPYGDDEAWAMLATELGANPGNWVADREGRSTEPGTEFATARKLAYRLSQRGRGALPEEAYAHIFVDGRFEPQLLDELQRRRTAASELGHVDRAP